MFQKAVDFLFGYDYFISYAWSDGRTYALALARELRSMGFSCFLDSEEYVKGQDWRVAGQRAIRKTSRLALIGTTNALLSDPVLREVEAFARTGRMIVPLCFGSTLVRGPRQGPLFTHLSEDLLEITETAERLAVGPSEGALRELRKSFTVTRQNQKRIRWLAVAAGVFAAVAGLAVVAGLVARRRANESLSRALAAQARLELPRNPDAALLLAAHSYGIDPLDESLNSLATALDFAPTETFLHTRPAVPGAVAAVADERLAVCTWDGALSLWDVPRRARVQSLALGKDGCRRLAMSPVGGLLAVGGRGAVHIVEVSDAAKATRHAVKGATGPIAWVSATQLAVAAEGDFVDVLDVHTGEAVPAPLPHTAPPDALAMDWTRGILVSGGTDLRLVFTTIGPPASTLQVVPTGKTITALAASADGRWLAVGTHDHGLELWRLDQRVPAAALADAETDGRILGLAFSPDSRTLGWGGDGGAVRLLDFSNARRSAHEMHSDAVLSVALGGVGDRVISAGRDGRIWIGTREGLTPRVVEVAAFRSRGWITAATPMAAGAAIGTESGELLFLSASPMPAASPVAAHSARIAGLVAGAGATSLVSVGADGTLRQWAVRDDGALVDSGGLTRLPKPPERVLQASDGRLVWITADGEIGFARADGRPDLQPPIQLSPKQRIRANGGPLVTATHPQQPWLVIAVNGTEIWSFDLRSGDGRRVGTSAAGITDLRFDPEADSVYVASPSAIEVWPTSATGGAPAISIPVGVKPLGVLCPLQNSPLLASANTFGQITFWGLRSWTQVGPWIQLPGTDVGAMVPSGEPGEFYTFTRSYDASAGVNTYRVHRWAGPRRWPDLARTIANRALTDAERQRFGIARP